MIRGSDLELALELADIADAITMKRYRAVDLAVETKPDMTPVTESDRAAELALRERIAEAMPDDAVIGEEFGAGRRSLRATGGSSIRSTAPRATSAEFRPGRP